MYAIENQLMNLILKNMEHPYKEYENTHTWDVVQQTITELVENNDIELQTPIEYVIGYICRNLSSTEHIGKSLEKNKLYEKEEDCKIHARNRNTN